MKNSNPRVHIVTSHVFTSGYDLHKQDLQGTGFFFYHSADRQVEVLQAADSAEQQILLLLFVYV